jgi:HPt (histidine-containing phosphotransfer) domain-containing protein
MTAHAMAGDREKSLAAGMNDHIAKPINPQELFATLLKWIKPSADSGGARLPETEATVGANFNDPDNSPLPSPDGATDDLPSFLPGFDIKAGLKRLQGNRRLYRKLLLDFGRDYREAADHIHLALIAGDIKQVHSLVHNIKGLAGNLSADRLQEAATQMDRMVKKVLAAENLEPEQLDSRFEEMKTALEEALSSCRGLDSSDGQESNPSDHNSEVTLPADLARRTATRLQEAADMGDINGLKKIAAELNSEHDSYGEISEKIVRLAEDFDFDGIIKLADELESRSL